MPLPCPRNEVRSPPLHIVSLSDWVRLLELSEENRILSGKMMETKAARAGFVAPHSAK